MHTVEEGGAAARASAQSGRISARSVITGALLCLIISVGFTYSRVALAKAGMSSDYITASAVCVFFAVILFLNPAIKLIHRSWGFDRAELAVIYIMLIISATIPTWGFSGNLVSMLPAVYYFATPENRWVDILHPLVKSWMVPQDETAIKDFFEGLPEGAPIPWEVWTVPLLAWGSLIICVYLMMIATMVLVRRQWVEHERLTFPLVQLPLEMIDPGQRRDILSPFLKNPMMWIGFTLAFGVLSTKALHFYFPVIPEAQLYSVARFASGVEFNLSFTVLGLAYLLSLQIATSFWFFHLLAKCQMGLQFMTGYRLKGDIERFMEGTLMVAHQGMGAMLVLVLFGIWISRRHLKAIFQKIISGAGVDDGDEILSYRAAAAILIICGGYVTVWLNLSGVPLVYTIVFLLLTFAIFMFMARLIAEGGLGFIRPQMTAQNIVINFGGASAVTDTGIFSLALTFSWAGNLRILLMASAINAMKLAQGVGILRRGLFWVMITAIIVSLVSSLWMIIWAAYEHGAVNLERWFYTYNPRGTFEFAAYQITTGMSFWNTPDIVWPRAVWTGIGAAVMGVLVFLHHHFLWWPLHPIGFAVSATNMTSAAWFSIFIGSVVKAAVLKYGGIKLYYAVRPMFLGFILGQISCAAFWLVVDILTGSEGSRVSVFTHHY